MFKSRMNTLGQGEAMMAAARDYAKVRLHCGREDS